MEDQRKQTSSTAVPAESSGFSGGLGSWDPMAWAKDNSKKQSKKRKLIERQRFHKFLLYFDFQLSLKSTFPFIHSFTHSFTY